MEEINTKVENKMGVMQINKLLINMSLPMMLSMLVQALYNIVDSIFVSKISEEALTAVSLCFPIQNLMIAILVGTSIGVNAVLSRKLGEKDYVQVDKIANTAIFIAVCCGLGFMLLGLLATERFIDSQTENELIRKNAISYMRIVTVFSMPLSLLICFEKLLSSTGRTFDNMITQMTGAILNIILDPIFIFVLKMGVEGAAIATVIGQVGGLMIGVYLNLTKNKEIHIDLRQIRPQLDIIRKIYSVGLPSIIMQSLGSFTLFGLNTILMRFSATAVAFFGVYFKLQSFIILPILGLANGMIPIVAYNYGARKKDRIISAVKVSLKYSVVLMSLGILILQIFPVQLLSLFEASDAMIAIGIPAVRTISTALIFASISIILSSMFQALGNGFTSMIISSIRQILVLLPIAHFFSLRGNINMVWSAFAVAEIIALIMCILFAKLIIKKVEI